MGSVFRQHEGGFSADRPNNPDHGGLTQGATLELLRDARDGAAVRARAEADVRAAVQVQDDLGARGGAAFCGAGGEERVVYGPFGLREGR